MKKKIFHIIPTLMSGGAERLLADIVSGTSNRNFSHIVCVLGKSEFFAQQIRESGGEVIDLNLSGNRPWLKAARKISPLVKRHKPDLILSWLYDASIVSRLVKLRNKDIPLITTLHAPDYDLKTIKAGNWSPRKTKILRLIDKLTVKLTDPYFVSCSHFVASSYQKMLAIDSAKMRVIHNFVNPESLACAPAEPPQIRASLGISTNDFVYINVGRLAPQKGQAYLLQAFQKVLAEIPQAHLVIVGTGGLEVSLQELAKSLQIAHRVHFLGRRKDIGACLAMANVFVFPTLFEGFGIALTEAMAKELPCISTRLDVIEEIIEDGVSGILVAPETTPELAVAMLKMFHEPERCREIGLAGFHRVKNHFFSDIIIPQWGKLFDDLAA